MKLSSSFVVATAIVGALATSGVVTLANAGPAAAPSYKFEKCYGIAKAGHNDCASQGNNSCAGTSKRDNERSAWIFVPAGTCSKIVGANLAAM
ncbi:MAG: DUF2282 domain-containing protein [Micropepsaceae bacterium]